MVDPPWIRAGGWTEPDWRTLRAWVVEKIRVAESAYDDFAGTEPLRDKPMDAEKAERLQAEVTRWHRLLEGVSLGDPKMFNEAHGLMTREQRREKQT